MQTQPRPGTGRSLMDRFIALTDAFAWPLRTSHYLELVNPLWTTHALDRKSVV